MDIVDSRKTGKDSIRIMSEPRVPPPVKVVSSLFTADDGLMHEVLEKLEDHLGPIDFISEKFDFSHTDYYDKEFDGPLYRKIVSFERLIIADKLPSIKLFTNGLEVDGSSIGKRHINIDPGYIALEKLVLASCKNFAHRLYLGNGIFAEITLSYKSGYGFLHFDWTYPDYRDTRIKGTFMEIRKRYKEQFEALKR